VISDYYTESVVLYEPATSTAVWGSEPGWSTSPSTFMAAVNPVSGSVLLRNDKETPLADYKLYCSSTVSIMEHDKVIWSGDTFDVTFVKNTFAMDHHLLCLLKKISL
jgi:hypothetical protein